MQRHSQFNSVIVILMCLVMTACGSSSEDETTTTEQTPVTTPVSPTPTNTVNLVINEVIASPVDDGLDTIELYAIADIADLSVYTIVDDNASHTPQSLPQIALSAGEFIAISAIDEEDTPPESGYYVTFKLGSDDAVYLYEGDNIINELDWDEGDAPEGYSYGLYVDGTGDAQTLQPTPGQVNQQYEGPIAVTDTIVSSSPLLRINEIVAKDADDGEDWIEVYASGTEAVFLGDYSVTDENGELFPLPDVTIAAGEFYRVFTTDDPIDGEYNVAFKLGSSDQVSLFLGDDLIDNISWDKGEALIGYSFGRFPDGSDATSTLIPSIVTSNALATRGPLVINEVVASQNDDSSDWFELYNNSTQPINLSEYQVIDGSDDIDPITLPDEELLPGQYRVFLANGEETTNNNVNFKLGKEEELSLIHNDETVDFLSWQESDVSPDYSYGLRTDGSWQETTLHPSQNATNVTPTIYAKDTVKSIYFEIDESAWDELLTNALDEQYYVSSVTFDGVTLDEVGIRTKGNSSLNSVYRSGGERYSFNIDVNEYVDGQRLLGMKKFVLNNMFNDPSYMREFIAYELLDEMGVATPQFSYVNVFVNGDLKGLYLMVEFVNKDFLQKHFTNSQGDLYKPDGVGSDLQYIDDNFASYSDVELKTNEDSSDHGAFLNLVNQMAYGDALSAIEPDSVLRYLAVSVALSNLDSYQGSLAHNYYIYEQDDEFSFIPWDLNESFGTFNQGCNRVDIRELYIDEPTSGRLADRPLLYHVLSNESLLTTYHSYLQQLIDGPLNPQIFAQRVNDISSMIAQHVENDPTSFYSYFQFIQNQSTTVERFFGLTSFIEYRVDNMQKQLNGELPSKGNGSGFCGN